MIRSMTGFGDASCEVDGVHYAVELRSLNNRYFKASIRLPDLLSSLEPRVESQLRKRFTRGSITLNVNFKDTSATAAYEINEAALESYLEHLETIEARANNQPGDQHVTIDLGSMLALPGVVQPPDDTDLSAKAAPVIADLVEKAADRMLAMRESEGNGLVEDLCSHLDVILRHLELVIARAPVVVEEYHQRLSDRVENLIAKSKLDVATPDLMREVAIYADRCDISEECQRLRAHVEHCRHILTKENEEPAGRTLDFISQELLREANTIASKSNDAEIARTVVAVKSSIDRIKEQVQNVE